MKEIFVDEIFIRTYMSSISEYVYIDKLDDIVNKYDDAYYSAIKMEHIDVKWNILTLVKKMMMKLMNLKLVILFCKRLCSKLLWRSFVIKKLKITVPWTYMVSDLQADEIVGTFYEKELQKANQKDWKSN